MKKTPKTTKRGAERRSKPPVDISRPKRPRGRPRKNGVGREDVYVGLSPAFLVELDAYVAAIRDAGEKGVGRGDVLTRALKAFLPFRAWRRGEGA